MERYDGKTRKDDYIKYGLITFAVVLVFGGILFVNHLMRQKYWSTPDYKVVIASEEAFNDAMVDQVEDLFKSLVGDRNGDGRELVEVEVLRLTDYKAAQNADAQAWEDYDAGLTSEFEQKFSGLTVDDDLNRMMLELLSGECYLFIMSDQPRGEFRGAATVYGTEEYFMELPTELQDPENPCRMDLTNATFLQDLGLEDIPFYGFVLEPGDKDESDFAVDILGQLKTARASIW